MKNKKVKDKYKIIQRKPDPEQDKSSYSTAIIDREGMPIVIGYGFTQGDADDNVIKQFILIADKLI